MFYLIMADGELHGTWNDGTAVEKIIAYKDKIKFAVSLYKLNMRSFVSEFLGTLLLVATVVGSGIMAENLSMGNQALALLANAIATGAILYVLITIFNEISGAHFNSLLV